MKFKFSLDPVLKVRDHKKKMHKQKLAEELANKQQIMEVREEVQQKLKGFLDNSDNEEIQNVHMLRQRASHIQEVHVKMNKLSEDLSKADESVSRARTKLAEAHKNLHIIEKVKESELTIFNQKVAKQEQKFLDEVATQSFSR